MEGSDRRSALEIEAELHGIRNIRYRLQDRLLHSDRRAGEFARVLVEEHGYAKSDVARILGVSSPHVGALIGRSSDAGAPTMDGLIPLVPFYDARRYLTETGTAPKRVIGGFDGMDVLLASGMSPDHFVDDDYLLVPHMLWMTANSRWIGIDQVNVGYGGTGPGHARDLLLEVGFAEDFVRHVVDQRFFVIDIPDGDLSAAEVEVTPPVAPEVDPVSRRDLPKPRAVGKMFVVEFDQDDLRLSNRCRGKADAKADAGDDLSLPESFGAWVDILDRPELPEWLMRGPSEDEGGAGHRRVARVFLDRAEAARQGFVARSHRMHRGPYGQAYSIVIEQGRLQLWLRDYLPQDPTQPLSDEAFEVLAYAGLYPPDLADLRPRARFSAYWRRILGAPQPAYIDISTTGSGTLGFVPSRDLRRKGQ